MNNNFSIYDSIIESFQDFIKIMADAIPRIIIVVVIFFAGYLVAKIVSRLVSRALKALNIDRFAEKMQLDEPLRIIGAKDGLSPFLGKIVFWLIMLVVIVSSSDKIGVPIISEQIRKIIDFIPKLISATLILLAGYFIATKLKNIITNVSMSLGKSAGNVLGSVVYWFLMTIIIVTALDQTGIDTNLISNNMILIVGVLLFAGAAAYAYAARDIMSNMLSSFFGKKNFRIGQTIKINNIEGTIVDIDNTTITIKTINSKLVIPAKDFVNSYVEILDEN